MRPKKGFQSAENPIYALLFERKPDKGERAKAEIIDATVRLLATRGFHETSFETIAKEIGVGRSHVAYHFADLEELLAAAIRLITLTAQSITVEELKKGDEGWESLVTGYVSGAFYWIQRNPAHFSLLMLFYHLSTIHPRFRKLHTEIRAAGRKRIHDVLLRSEIGAALGPEGCAEAAALIQGQITGTLVEFGTTDSPVRLEELRRSTLALVFKHLRGRQ